LWSTSTIGLTFTLYTPLKYLYLICSILYL
jgi:hypothetical protein